MSLTSHLKNKHSAIRQFIYASAPELGLAGTAGHAGKEMATSFGFDEITALETRLPIPEKVKNRKGHAVVAGMAFDYGIRMSLPGFDVNETTAQMGLDLLASNPGVVHRGKHIHKMLEMALNYALTLHQEENDLFSIANASIPLAWCETILRDGPQVALTGELGRQIKRAKNPVDLSTSTDELLSLDIAVMLRSAGPLLEQWNRDISSGVQYVPNPKFLGSAAVGGADADMVIQDLLLDFKARESITNPWVRDTLFQLLGYVLLDLDDSLGIRKVGLLLPRQPYFMGWSLDELFRRPAEEVLPELRADFAVLLTKQLELPL